MRIPFACCGALTLAVGCAGCATKIERPPTPSPKMSDSYLNSAEPTRGVSAGAIGAWWRGLNDPVIDNLVDRALQRNTNVRAAVARIDQARALRRGTASEGLPQINVDLSAGRERISAYQAGFIEPVTQNAFNADLSVSWELDVFGRIRSGIRAAEAEIDAAQSDLRAVRVVVVATVVGSGLLVRGLDQRIEIVTHSQFAQNQIAVDTRRMFEAGTVGRGDLDRAESQAASTGAEIPALQLKRQIVLNHLASIVALPTREVYERFLVTEPASKSDFREVSVGVPAELLRRRPDIQAAEARLLAANARLGVAKAELKPHFVLTGLIGSLASAFTGEGLARTVEWIAAAGAQTPLIDGGRRRSVVALRSARTEEALVQYQATVLRAVEDVENVLSARGRDNERLTRLTLAAARARSATEQVRNAWRAGELPILDLLEAERAQLATDDALEQVRTAVLLDQVLLYSVLAGGTDEEDVPSLDSPET